MAITDLDPAAQDLRKGAAKTVPQLAGATAADAAPAPATTDLAPVLPGRVTIPPSLRDADRRRAARAREATVAGWLRRLSSAG